MCRLCRVADGGADRLRMGPQGSEVCSTNERAAICSTRACEDIARTGEIDTGNRARSLTAVVNAANNLERRIAGARNAVVCEAMCRMSWSTGLGRRASGISALSEAARFQPRHVSFDLHQIRVTDGR